MVNSRMSLPLGKKTVPESCHVQFESFKCGFIIIILHVEELDGHIPVPVAHVHGAEPAAPDLVLDLQLLVGDVPLADGHLPPARPG